MYQSITKYISKVVITFILLFVAIILNHRNGYITFIGLLSFFIFFEILLKRICLDLISILLLVYSFLYLLFSHLNGIQYDISILVLYGLGPFLFYEYGVKATKIWEKENERLLFWLIIIACYGIDIFSTIIRDIFETGEIINPSRIFNFKDSGEMMLSATQVGLSADIGMIGLPMFFILKKTKIRYFYLILFLLSILTTVHLLNRTGLIISILCTLGVLCIYYRKKPIGIIKIVLLMLAILVILYCSGIVSQEVFGYYAERNVDLSTMGSRTVRWKLAISNLFSHPYGWSNGDVYYVHNMWLDIARLSGLIPFGLLIFFTIRSFYKVFKLLKYTNDSVAYLMLGLNLCFFLSCFVEPIFGGTHLMLYAMLWGFEESIYNQIKITTTH